MNVDGTNVVRLIDVPSLGGRHFSWSPDGRWIALTQMGQWYEIYRVNADGTNLINLTNHPAWDSAPAWSPDGAQIAFTSSRDGGGIYVMNADGTGVFKLTSIGSITSPVWYGPKNLAVEPHHKQFTTWGWLKGR